MRATVTFLIPVLGAESSEKFIEALLVVTSRERIQERGNVNGDEATGHRADDRAMFHRPECRTRARGARIESAVRTVVAGHRFHQVIRPVWIFGLARLLPVIRGLGQIMIEQAASTMPVRVLFPLHLSAPLPSGRKA